MLWHFFHFDYFYRYTCGYGVVWNIFRYHSVGTNRYIITNLDTSKNLYTKTKITIISHGNISIIFSFCLIPKNNTWKKRAILTNSHFFANMNKISHMVNSKPWPDCIGINSYT